jgi:hypothetical protein
MLPPAIFRSGCPWFRTEQRCQALQFIDVVAPGIGQKGARKCFEPLC